MTIFDQFDQSSNDLEKACQRCQYINEECAKVDEMPDHLKEDKEAAQQHFFEMREDYNRLYFAIKNRGYIFLDNRWIHVVE